MRPTMATRTKRFQRRPTAGIFRVTDRDLALLSHVARHRFLSSKHLAALDGGSEQNVLRRLRDLFDHGYLDRPHAQLANMPVTGPRRMVYGLGRRGAKAISEHHRQDSNSDWTERNKRAGSNFIEHTLAIADFIVALELACRENGDIELLYEEDVLAAAPAGARAAREPLRITVPGTDKRFGVSSVVADGLFGLAFPDETASYFLLEVDRGSMPVTRSRIDQSHFKRKLALYWEAWKQKRYSYQFGLKTIRLLTITKSMGRVENMIRAAQDVTDNQGSNFFLFTAQPFDVGTQLAEMWSITGKGERVRLTD